MRQGEGRLRSLNQTDRSCDGDKWCQAERHVVWLSLGGNSNLDLKPLDVGRNDVRGFRTKRGALDVETKSRKVPGR